MKKYISLVLIFSFLFGAFSLLPISAATGTAIGDSSAFLSMSQEGTYYLSKDITLTSSYAKEFKGTLDGNGHTITISGAKSIFSKLTDATVKNLTIVGEITSDTSTAIGALAPTGSGTFTNISTNVNITISEKAGAYSSLAGTLIGSIGGKSTVTNCTSYGAVKLNGTGSGTGSLGGLIGGANNAGTFTLDGCRNYADIDNKLYSANNGGIIGTSQGSTQLTLKNCINFATINGTSGNHSGSAGIIGKAQGANAPTGTANIISCVNFGLINDNASSAIAPQSHHIGGILGRGYGMSILNIDKCLNAGEVVSLGGGWASAGGIAGGIMTYGFSWVGTHSGTVKVTNSVNCGKVSGGAFTGGIVGGALQFNTNESSLTVDKCANYGDVIGRDIAGGIVGECGEDAFNGLAITYCYNKGNVTATGTRGAGILGMFKPMDGGKDNTITQKLPRTIEFCVNAGAVSSPAQSSAIIGGLDKATITVKDCANVGELMSNVYYQLGPKLTGLTSKNNYTIHTPMKNDPYVKSVNNSAANSRDSSVRDLVPSDVSEFLILISVCLGHREEDYSSGWSGFAAAMEAALSAIVDFTNKDAVSTAHGNLRSALSSLKTKETVDRSKLNFAIITAKAQENKLYLYTNASQLEFENAYAWAQAVKQANASQALVNEALAALEAALDGLSEKVDKGKIVALVEKYSAYNAESYMAASWQGFNAEYRDLLVLYRQYEISVKELEKATSELEAAEKLLIKRGDMFTLQAKLEEIAEKYPSQNYVEGTYAELSELIASTSSLLTDQKFSQAELEELFARFDAAIAKLVKKADFGEVDVILEGAKTLKKNDYTADSWAALESVLDKIAEKRKLSHTDTGVTDADAAALKTELEAALSALVGLADYSMHDEIIAGFSATYKEGYTDESVARVEAAIARIDELKAKTSTTSNEAKSALAELSRAIAGLEVKEVGTLIEDESDAPSATPDPEKKGCGGVIATTAVVMTSVLALGAAFVAKKKED